MAFTVRDHLRRPYMPVDYRTELPQRMLAAVLRAAVCEQCEPAPGVAIIPSLVVGKRRSPDLEVTVPWPTR